MFKEPVFDFVKKYYKEQGSSGPNAAASTGEQPQEEAKAMAAEE